MRKISDRLAVLFIGAGLKLRLRVGPNSLGSYSWDFTEEQRKEIRATVRAHLQASPHLRELLAELNERDKLSAPPPPTQPDQLSLF